MKAWIIAWIVTFAVGGLFLWLTGSSLLSTPEFETRYKLTATQRFCGTDRCPFDYTLAIGNTGETQQEKVMVRFDKRIDTGGSDLDPVLFKVHDWDGDRVNYSRTDTADSIDLSFGPIEPNHAVRVTFKSRFELADAIVLDVRPDEGPARRGSPYLIWFSRAIYAFQDMF